MNKVLVYHTICEPHEALPSNIDVSAGLFEQHLRWLSGRRERVCSLDQLLQTGSANNKFAITFDDGFTDNLTIALPLLEKYQFPMTLFAVAGFIGKEGYLSEAELKEISDHPLVTVGSHSMTHRHLSRLKNQELRIELQDSKHELERITGKQVDLLAYPYGDCSISTEMMAEACGYRAAWSVWNGTNSAYSQWRVPLGRSDSLPRFIAKVSRAYYPIKRFLRPPEVLA